MPDDLARQRSLLTTTLVAAQLRGTVPGRPCCAWLESWSGAWVIDSMNDLGYDVRLTQSPFGWWVEFGRSRVKPLPKWLGQGHDAAEPGRAVRFAALDTLRRDRAE
jgi:hypothetical protein